MRYLVLGCLLVSASAWPALADSDIILPSGLTVVPGQQRAFTVKLAQPAPPTGVYVSLTTSDPSKLVLSASAVLINQGLLISRPVQITGISAGTASISASASGLTGDVQTVTVGSSVGAITLPSIITLTASQSTMLPIAISPSAPSGGTTLTLTNTDGSKASLSSSSVFIPAGSTMSATQVQMTGLAAGVTTVTASAPGYAPSSATVQVQGATDKSALSFTPSTLTIGAGNNTNIQLNLSTAAPASGLVCNLVSSNAAVAVPTTVTINSNTTSVSVPVRAVGTGSATITATAAAGNVLGASAVVTVSSGRDISLPAGVTVAPGAQASFPITLAQPAPSSGVFVSLVSSDTSKLTISPANVLIGQGQTTLTRPPVITGVAAGSATVTATASGLLADSQLVLVGAASALVPGNLTITGAGGTQYLSLTLSGSAGAGGVIFTLSSSNPAVATVPAAVTVPAGASSVSVPVTGVAQGTAVIHASLLPGYPDTTSTVNVVNTGAITLPAGVIVPLGQTVAFPVALGAAAPAGGVVITLTDSDPSKVGLSTFSVFIPAGATTPAAQLQVTGLASGSSVIGASAPGYTSASQTVQVQASPTGQALSFSPGTLTLAAGVTGSIQLILSSAAPTGGLTTSLASSNTGSVSVPAAVTINGGTTSVAVPVTAVAAGSATISASTTSGNVTGASATVIVSSTGDISLPSGVSVAIGDQVSFPITLAQPAPPAGVFISLSSSDTTKATITPALVLIPQGATTVARAPQLTGVSAGSAVISASATGIPTVSQAVLVTNTPGFSPSAVTITGIGTTQTLTLTIPTAAPASGLVVTLTSDDPTIATVPAIIQVPTGLSSVSVPITSVGPGSTAIHAVALPILPNTTAAVSVVTSAVSATWYGACWHTDTFYGTTGNFQGIDFALTTSTPVPVQGSLFFTANCDPSGGIDNMDDFNSLTGSGHWIQGFTHHPDMMPSSAIYWVGPRTADGMCPKGSPCSGCVNYTRATPNCSTMP